VERVFDLTNLTKSEINAEKIMRRIHIHNQDFGGVVCIITGSPGTGKTAAMLAIIEYTLRYHPKEKVFFSNCYDAPLQFTKLKPYQWRILVRKDSNVTFHDRDKRGKQIHPEVEYFKLKQNENKLFDFSDLYKKAKRGKCNVVFFGGKEKRYMWLDFVRFLRRSGEWSHVFIDEISECCPEFSSGRLWQKIRQFSVDVKELRKCQINLVSNTQSISDIDHRVRKKLMVHFWLPGSITGKPSRITQKAIDALKEDPYRGNECFIEESGKFGKLVFKDIFKPNPIYHWDARCEEVDMFEFEAERRREQRRK